MEGKRRETEVGSTGSIVATLSAQFLCLRNRFVIRCIIIIGQNMTQPMRLLEFIIVCYRNISCSAIDSKAVSIKRKIVEIGDRSIETVPFRRIAY